MDVLGIGSDLKKAMKGNKAVIQRVRTNSIKFGKLAKTYRKESISEGKKKAKKIDFKNIIFLAKNI